MVDIDSFREFKQQPPVVIKILSGLDDFKHGFHQSPSCANIRTHMCTYSIVFQLHKNLLKSISDATCFVVGFQNHHHYLLKLNRYLQRYV